MVPGAARGSRIISASRAQTVSVYECLAEDEQFPWPDYGGVRMTIQDCWRTRDRLAMQRAIRRILKRMNAVGVELPQSFEKADFCGATCFQVPSPQYEKLCPKRLVEWGDLYPASPEKRQRRMEENGKRYETETVICSCTGCVTGVEMGGIRPFISWI